MDASGAADESATLRTAKSCGPDASMVGVKCRRSICEATVTTKPDHRGEREISCNTTACGNAGCPGATVVTNARAYYHTTRGCGCNGHPAFPAPLGVAPRPPFQGEGLSNNSGATRRGNAKVCFAVIACDKRGAFVAR